MFNNPRLILPVWQRFLVLLLLFAVTLTLWLARVRWVPLFSHYLGTIEQQASTLGAISSVIDIGGAVFNIAILLLVILTGTRLFADDNGEFSVVTPVTLNKLQAGRRLKWINRRVVTPSDLARNRRVLIVGHANQGKSREAIELIRASGEETDLVPLSRVYMPAPALFFRNAASLGYLIKRQLDLHTSLLLFLDDFTEWFPLDRLDLVSALLDELDANHSLLVVATADKSQLNSKYVDWFSMKEFKVAELRDFNSAEVGELVTSATQSAGLNLTQEGLEQFVSLSNGNPRQVLSAVRLLASQGVNSPTRAQIIEVMPPAQVETWEIERNVLFRRMPAARYLLEAMSTFSALGITAFASLVIPFASQLWARQQKSPSPFWKRERVLKQTLVALGPYEVGGQLTPPGYMIEQSLSPDIYLRSLETYLLGQAKAYRLRIVPPEQRKIGELLICLLELSQRYLVEPGGHEAAERLLKSALQITGNRRLGSYVLSELARLRIPSPHSKEGKRVSSYDIAWQLLALRGVFLALGEKYTESLVSLDEALGTAVDSQDAAEHVPKLLMVHGLVLANSGDIALALRALDQAIALDPTNPTLYMFHAEAHFRLGNSTQALSDILKALELKPDYLEALLWKVILQMRGPDKRGVISAITEAQQVCGSQDCSNDLIASLHAIKGALFEELGELEHAQAECSAAIASSDNYSAYRLRGQVNVQLLEYDAALSDFERARELAPDNHARDLLPEEGLEFATFFVFQSSKVARDAATLVHRETRLIDLLRTSETSPNNPALLYALSMRFLEKDTALSLHFIERAISLAPNEHILYGFRAILALTHGNAQQALSNYRIAADLSPHPKIAEYYLMQIADINRVAEELVKSFIADELPEIVKKIQENHPPKLS